MLHTVNSIAATGAAVFDGNDTAVYTPTLIIDPTWNDNNP
jgi:hypothetical protein